MSLRNVTLDAHGLFLRVPFDQLCRITASDASVSVPPLIMDFRPLVALSARIPDDRPAHDGSLVIPMEKHQLLLIPPRMENLLWQASKVRNFKGDLKGCLDFFDIVRIRSMCFRLLILCSVSIMTICHKASEVYYGKFCGIAQVPLMG